MTDRDRLQVVDKYRAILLLGPPGSGKGTQGKILGKVPGFCLVSMGQLLRSLDRDSKLGREIRPYMEKGDLAPSELAIEAWATHMATRAEDACQPGGGVLVLDGLPRNVEQAEMLQSRLNVERVVHLFCDEDILLDRLRGRRDTADRDDDSKVAIVRHRLEVYRQETLPLVDWYDESIVTPVDASGSPLGVLRQIVDALARHAPFAPQAP